MAAARKPLKKTHTAKGRTRNTGTRPTSVAAPPSAETTILTTFPLEPSSCPIVGIGASAGGLEALEEFFSHIPPSSGMAFLVVSHHQAERVSLLPSLLSRHTALPVVEVTDGIKVEPDHVYLAPGGTYLAILHGVLHLMESYAQTHVPLPIDYCFRSLAEDQKHQAIGIILSGIGTDGTLGLRAIKAEAGMTVAQDPQTAKYQGMPRSAIAAGVVDVVQPADRMFESLRAYAYSLTKSAPTLLDHDTSQTLQKIFILLRDRTGADFALYKDNTIRRRIQRRMHVHQIENLRQYLQFLRANPYELDALFQEALIGVTSFFRDAQAFETLAQKWLPSLIEGKPEGATLRVWVAGCSTGEEAYSLAIVLKEYLRKRKRHLTVQLFASDLDGQAIAQARAGLYPIGIAGDITPERLKRFFTSEDTNYRIKKDIRDLVVFATHNLLIDAPFTKLDLLSCRNLLIYLEAKAQRKVMSIFHYALKPTGILWLGPSESIGGFASGFTSLDQKWKFFKRTTEPSTLTHLHAFTDESPRTTSKTRAEAEAYTITTRPTPTISDLIQQLLVERYAPVAVLVNSRGEVVYIHGHTGAYLELAPGPPTQHLVDMAREGLRLPLATALHQAVSREDDVVRRDVRMAIDGQIKFVTLTVKHLVEPEPMQGLFLVIFDQERAHKRGARKGVLVRSVAPLKKRDRGLRQDLEYTKLRLPRPIEELQASNEGLKSTNEELQSTNEELQSANEELETAKEEMQSLNEELVIVNSELQGKLDGLAETSDDLQNLLNSTEVATIFLDNNLCIRRFTSAAKRVSNLIATDIGRPLSDIVSKLAYERLSADTQDVLQTLVFKEQEVQAIDGNWFFMRILPYRTSKNTIDGLVLTFLDIGKMKHAEQVIRDGRAFATSIVETVREPLVVLDDQFRVDSANQAFYRTFQLTPREVEQELLYHLCNGAWNMSALRRALEEILTQNASFQDFAVDQTFPRIGHKTLALNGRRLEQEPGKPGRILLAMEDLTGRVG